MIVVQSLKEVLAEANKHFESELKKSALLKESDRILYVSAWLRFAYNNLYIAYTSIKPESPCTE